jgi:hypothetical protein
MANHRERCRAGGSGGVFANVRIYRFEWRLWSDATDGKGCGRSTAFEITAFTLAIYSATHDPPAHRSMSSLKTTRTALAEPTTAEQTG